MNRHKAKMSSWAVLAQLLRFLTPYKGHLLGAGGALVFTSAITLTLGKGVQILIDSGFGGRDSTALSQSMLFILLLAVLMAAGTFIRFYLVSWLGERVSADLRRAVFNNIVRLHPGYFEDNRSGEIMSRLTTDTSLLQTIIGSSFSMALRSSLTMIGALVMMLFTNLKLSLIILVGVPLIVLPIILFGQRVRRLSSHSQDSIAHVGSYAGEIIRQIKTVQAYTRESQEQTQFAGEVERAFAIARKRIFQRALLIGIAMILLFAGMTGMLWEGGRDVISGQMSAGELGSFVFYAIMVGNGVAMLAEVWGDIQRAVGATERLLDLLNEKSAIIEPSHPVDTTPDRAGMSLNNVCFSYPSRPEKLALNHFSLSITPGQSLALVGPSGAGKSTIFELLLRFYDPQSGSITLGDQDIRCLTTEQLRRHIALVPQQPVLFSGTIAQNIRYGCPDASDDDMITAARAAHAHDFIAQLPKGYHSDLGEQGVRLSGGQKQRIALARALLSDADILLLDEATSALDAESEHHVQAALETLMKNRTTVIIAHRLSTIIHADHIAVLKEGQLVATGTHKELLQSSPLYARLAQLQFNTEPK